VNPLSVSIIGCGRIAFEFESDPLRKKPASHIGAVTSLPELYTLHSICDHQKTRLEKISGNHRICRTYTSHKQLFSDFVPDIAVISASTPSHVPVARDAIAAGVRGIVLEKPVSPSLLEARRLLSLQETTRTPVLIFHERRYDPLFNWAFRQIKTETYGPVRSVSARLCSASFPRGDMKNPYLHFGGGALFHDGTHMLDILSYLLSPFQDVSARMQHLDPSAAVETCIRSLMTTTGGIPVYLDIDGTCDYFHFELDVFLQSARFRIGNGIRELSVNLPAKQYSGFTSLQAQPFPSVPSGNPFINAYRNLHGAVTREEPLVSSLRDGVLALEHIYGIYRSCSRHGHTVHFPLKSSRHPYGGRSFFLPG